MGQAITCKQNRKYITYHSATRASSTHGHRQHATLDIVSTFAIWDMLVGRQTYRHADCNTVPRYWGTHIWNVSTTLSNGLRLNRRRRHLPYISVDPERIVCSNSETFHCSERQNLLVRFSIDMHTNASSALDNCMTDLWLLELWSNACSATAKHCMSTKFSIDSSSHFSFRVRLTCKPRPANPQERLTPCLYHKDALPSLSSRVNKASVAKLSVPKWPKTRRKKTNV